MSFKVAVVGATGAVGRVMLEELAKLNSPCKAVLFASKRSAGQELMFRGEKLLVEEFSLEKVADCKFVLMSAGGDFSRNWAQAMAERGCIVIDNSSAWRMHPEVKLIVPEVNMAELKGFRSGIIANPNCSTIQLVVTLAPLQSEFGLSSVNVATYQSVSGAGQLGIEDLSNQILAFAYQKPSKALVKMKRNIFDSLIPAIDVMDAEGHCYEEEKMVRETRKIMAMPELEVLATSVRVPTRYCHGEAVTVRLQRAARREEVLQAFRHAPGIRCVDVNNYESLPCPEDVVGKPDVLVGRVRLPLMSEEATLVQYWNVADNLRKGAASNAVQILEGLLSLI